MPERFDFFKTIIENNFKNRINKLINDKSNKKLDDKSTYQSINNKSVDKSLNDNKSNVNVITDKSIANDKLYPKTSTPKKQQTRLNTDNDNNLFKVKYKINNKKFNKNTKYPKRERKPVERLQLIKQERKPKQDEIIILDDDNEVDNTDVDNVDDNTDHAADISLNNLIDNINESHKNKKHYLFNGISKDKVCEICFKGKNYLNIYD